MKRLHRLLPAIWLMTWAVSLSARGPDAGERLFVQTDRSVYIAGEPMYYAAFLSGGKSPLSRYAYLLIRNANNRPMVGVRLELEARMAYGTIPLPDTLPSGVYQIACFTNPMRNGPGGDIFTREIVIANRFDTDYAFLSGLPSATVTEGRPAETGGSADRIFTIHADKQVYRPGEKITLTVVPTDPASAGWLRLAAGISESAAAVESIEETRFQIPPGISGCYPKETEAPVMQGRVVANGNGPAHGPFTLLLSAPDTLANLQLVETDSSGTFCVPQHRFFDGKQVVLRMQQQAGAALVMDNKFDIPVPFRPAAGFNRSGMRNYLQRSAAIVRVRKAYDLEEPIDTFRRFPPLSYAPRVYYDPYHKVIPAEFTALPDFVEIARNLVPALRVRKTRNQFEADFLNPLTQSYFDQEPAVFLDGVPVDDVNEIIRLGSADIRRIETFPVNRSFGDLRFPGILAVYSSHSAIDGVVFKTPALRFSTLQSEAYTLPKPVEAKVKRDHEPDLRQVLLWKPGVELKSGETVQLSCHASDLEGEYRIVATAITSDGRIFHRELRILVTLQSAPHE